jgi:hypothetical protein
LEYQNNAAPEFIDWTQIQWTVQAESSNRESEDTRQVEEKYMDFLQDS